MSRENEFRDKILAKASEDDEFRTELIDDPVGAIGKELSFDLPEGLNVQVHADGPNVVNLVLPPKVQLDSSELEGVSGGTIQDPYGDDWVGW